MNPTTGPRQGLYARFFARYYDRVQAEYEKHLAERKRELFAGVTGTIVEIGAGTGANLKYLPSDCSWIGIEPNPYMHESLRERARAAGIEPKILTGAASAIEVDDGAADIVIATLVLCSVPNVNNVLAEIQRILRPGGRFLFIEHVAASRGSALRVVQHVTMPAWYLFGHGCRINRDTGAAIRSAGFGSCHIGDFRVPRPAAAPWVSPHIAGQAVR